MLSQYLQALEMKMNRKVKFTLVSVGATSVAAAGAVVVAGFSYATAPGDSTRWSARFFEKIRVGKWLNRRITAWALDTYLNSLPEEEREDISRQTERLARVQDDA